MSGVFDLIKDCIKRRKFPSFVISNGKTGTMKCPACGYIVIAQTENLNKCDAHAFKCDSCGEEGKWDK